MYAFVAAAPVVSRSAFAGSAVSRAPAPVASTVTMKASKAIPFLEAPEKLDETKAGCAFVETDVTGLALVLEGACQTSRDVVERVLVRERMTGWSG